MIINLISLYFYIYNMINNKLLNISEKYKTIFNYEDFWYVNYDYIVFYKKQTRTEHTFEEVYNLLKPYIRKEKLNKILNEKN